MAEVLNLAGSPVALPKRMTRPNSAQAAQAFEGVFAGQAVKDGVHALAAGQFADALLVVVIDVVDAVGEAERGELGELFRAGGGAEELEAQDVAELHGGGAHASGGGVDEDARARFFAGWRGLDRFA